MASNQRVAVVTGSSSGIGHETSLTLARNGFLTYATMRTPDKGENIKSLAENEKLPLKTVQLDVTDGISVKNAIQSITAESSRIDVLVNTRLCYGRDKGSVRNQPIWCYKSDAGCPSHNEKTEVWYNCKY
ncbi:MAG: SDR family NAD(P)-dependent oxidoreductase [Candidatus Nitrosopolaris sp.]